MSELKDCPFCGCKASFHSDIPQFHGFGYGVGCSNPACVAYSGYGMAVFDTREDAVCAWNMRAKDAIVRCRDCEHSRNDGTFCVFFAAWHMIAGGDEYQEMPADVEPDGFCKWGRKRKEQ